VERERVVGILAPRPVRAVADVDAAVRRALRAPVGSRPLREILSGRRTALAVTVDATRPSPRPLLRPILDACRERGVTLTILIALGRHRRMTDAELRRHLGRDICRNARVLQHDAFDRANTVRTGATRRGTEVRVNREVFRHDVVIGVGIIEPSYLCGFSGGRKLLMPGLAYHESIDNNHYFLTHPDTRIGKLDGNPVSEDAAEFAAKLPLHFIVYTVNGPCDEVVKVVAGHPVRAHRLACERSARIFRVKPKQADIVISSAGGAPYDCDLVQGKKAIVPAMDLVRRNGVIILCAECREGMGAEATFVRWLKTKTPVEVVRDVLDRKQFNLGAHGANILARPIVTKNAKVVMVTCPRVAAELAGTYVTAVTSLPEAVDLASRLTGVRSKVLFVEHARRLIVESREEND
jgi:nickel-dependent lactate racemase